MVHLTVVEAGPRLAPAGRVVDEPRMALAARSGQADAVRVVPTAAAGVPRVDAPTAVVRLVPEGLELPTAVVAGVALGPTAVHAVEALELLGARGRPALPRVQDVDAVPVLPGRRPIA